MRIRLVVETVLAALCLAAGPARSGVVLPAEAARAQVPLGAAEAWAAQLHAFFASPAPDYSMLDEALPPLMRLEREGLTAHADVGPVLAEVQAAAAALQKAPYEGDAAAWAARTKKAALLKTELRIWAPEPARGVIDTAERQGAARMTAAKREAALDEIMRAAAAWELRAPSDEGAVVLPAISVPSKEPRLAPHTASRPPPPADPLALQQQRLWRRFLRDEKPAPREMTTLPKGLPVRVQPGLEAIRVLLGDPARVFAHLWALEREVLEEAARAGATRAETLLAVLARREAAHGFAPAVTLRDMIYRGWTFRRMLRRGALFDDPGLGGEDHGSLTHRIQWHLVMREMAARPEEFGDVRQASELFRAMGDEKNQTKDFILFRRGPDWSETGLEDEFSLWYQFVDTFEDNFSSPEYFHPRRGYWPMLGEWD